MDGQLNDDESLIARVQQLEYERDELRKDIEQLCVQQAGPSYLAVATRMHFQRTASLEQEIENLKKKLAACLRENSNLQEELSEAYRIKSQLADLHAAEVSKNMEVEKQIKFFHGCVATAFAERDHSIMEAEKAKEKEEVMLQKLNAFQMRVEVLTSDFLEEKKLTAALRTDLDEQKMQNESFEKVINKFYEIRQYSLNSFCEERSWEDKCKCLLHDSAELWSFNDHGEAFTSKYISALEEEVETLRKSADNLQNKLRVGLEIENHLKKKVHNMERKKTLLEEKAKAGIAGLLRYHSQIKADIVSLLDEGYFQIRSIIDVVEEKIRQLDSNKQQNWKSQRDLAVDEKDCQDVLVNIVAGPGLTNKWNDLGLPNSLAIASGEVSEALAQALQDKVAALLLLSQQEERQLLERNVNAALQKKVEELQRNILQVTNEKVKALMELAQLNRAYQHLQEKINLDMRPGKLVPGSGEKQFVQERDGRLKNLLKKSYLRHWIGTLDSPGDDAEARLNYEGNVSDRRSNNMDIARMKNENATLKESLECMEHLTSAVRRLRLSLLKVKESVTSEDTVTGMAEALEDIVTEAKLVKTALGSSLPVGWSAEADVEPTGDSFDQETIGVSGNPSAENVDFVSAAGFEMVEVLILAAHLLENHITSRGPAMEVD
ncbi:uncharacterized protein LOC130781488 isoform X1 [Actinidia eriantha]|uniref:uncharacterized protein LOC130781488 isoform X1 n=1 Tax=Actinidia eriantha TaxID=165200 RepID=UPI002584B96E|nr:uncharacterized protein LOC130781488 isoform X1 [Actinidia eriantha]XP_057496677.1 uncharacterized protein LOC130781488 isoform X1 [Actinidia eriantha]